MFIFRHKYDRKQPNPFCLYPLLCILVLVPFLPGCSPTQTENLTPLQYNELPPLRAIQVDLDYVYDPDPVQQRENLELLTSRVMALGIDTVFLQAFADPDGNGVAESLYFPSSYMPLRENLFASAAQALRHNGVAVYGWLPMLAFRLPHKNNELYVTRINGPGSTKIDPNQYLRLSPFNAQSRQIIEEIYRDFADQTAIDGILFHDDGILSDFEDSSDAALQQYKQAGFPADINTIRSDRALMRKWSRFKTSYLIDFSLSLFEIIRQQQPGIRSARNIFAGPVLDPESEMWFAQSLPLFTQAYDYTAIMAMPFMEKASEPNRWLEQLSWAALAPLYNSNQIIFELQSRNWLTEQPIDAEVLQRQIKLLAQMGVTSFAYYPDDFHQNMPPAAMVRACLSNPMTCLEGD